MLDSQALAFLYSEAELLTEIASIKADMDEIRKVKGYSLDDMQSKQKVDNQELKQLAELLNSYIKALAVKRGVSATELISLNYTGAHE